MARRIYIASSWRQADSVRELALVLREDGHEVYAFCEDGAGHYSFDMRDIPGGPAMTARQALDMPEAGLAFAADKGGLDWADTCVLLLPSGRSSHLEAGYTVGQGKELFILDHEQAPGQWDVMYGFAQRVVDLVEELVEALDA